MKYLLTFLLLFNINPSFSKSNGRLIKQYNLFKRASRCSFIITSSVRSRHHNRAVGGSPNSYHLHGKAYDLIPSKSCNKGYYELARIAKRYFNGVIVYIDHLHVDIRSNGIYHRTRRNKL